MKKNIIGLICAGLLSTSAVYAADMSTFESCGKRTQGAILLIDYSGSMMNKVQFKDEMVNRVVLSKKLVDSIYHQMGEQAQLAVGVGAIAPYTLTLPLGLHSKENLAQGLQQLPENLEIFGRNTNLGEGLKEILDSTAKNEKNRYVAQLLESGGRIFVLTDGGKENRGTLLSESLKQMKTQYPKSDVVLVSFANTREEDKQIAHWTENSNTRFYDGWELLENSNALEQFVSKELYKECVFSLSADVLFDFDKATLKPEGKKLIKQFVSDIKIALPSLKAAEKTLSISAHTDRIGSEAYNDELSKRRLNTVLKELEANGLDLSIFSEKLAQGKRYPITQSECNGLPWKKKLACYFTDRRVEIRVK